MSMGRSWMRLALGELLALGEQVERIGRSLKTIAAAQVAATYACCARKATAARRTGWPAPPARLAAGGAAYDRDGPQLAEPPATRQAQKGRFLSKQAEAIVGRRPPIRTRRHGCWSRPVVGRCASSRMPAGALGRTLTATRRQRPVASTSGGPTAAGPTRRGSGTSTCPVPRPRSSGSTTRCAIAATSSSARPTVGRREPAEAYAFDAVEALITRRDGADGKPIPRGSDAKIIVRIDHAALLRGGRSTARSARSPGWTRAGLGGRRVDGRTPSWPPSSPRAST